MQTNWNQLENVFRQRWALHAPPASTDVEKTGQLLNHRIKPEDVGKQVPFFGAIEYSHLDWAEEGLALAHQLGLESWTEYLHQVIEHSPRCHKGQHQRPGHKVDKVYAGSESNQNIKS